ncbi:hypothetical protein OAS39_11480 [Pirellulales bacterium]|nr:hypothetical protein [Pirellulales bacterium]
MSSLLPTFFSSVFICVGLQLAAEAQQPIGEPLPDTRQLEMTGDIASELVAGVDRFLLSELQQSVARRENYWQRDFSSSEAYQKSIEPGRQRLVCLSHPTPATSALLHEGLPWLSSWW